MQWSFGWEDQFLLFLQNQVRSPWLDALMGAVTRLGDAGILAICACILLLCIPSLRNTGVMAAQSLAMDVILAGAVIGLCTGWFAVWMGKRREQRKIAGVSENKD